MPGLRALTSKLTDAQLVDHLNDIASMLDQIHSALRVTSEQALALAKLAEANAAYGADRPAVVLLQESADSAARHCLKRGSRWTWHYSRSTFSSAKA
ncbi:hypothetical protein OG558_15635 [Kribbella sp. NBC_01510]|uniref:hypothetical protein n=1 Tax=Kribbella sp. NBC_01510 TaxID=2903581 RepID=UPI00386435C3